jgi:hypothetical protein
MAIPEKLLLITQQLAVSGNRIDKAIEDLADDDFYRCPETANHMLWLLGHAANSRLGLVVLMGGEDQCPWAELFSRGSQPGDRETLPPVSEVRDSWNAAVAALNTHFETLSDADLSKTCSREFPIGDKTVLGAAMFLAGHEMYHLGQMTVLKKWLGQGQLVG